jgi:hypothetical protein
MTDDSQPNLFGDEPPRRDHRDPVEGARRRDDAIEQVGRRREVSPLLDAVKRTAERRGEFTGDDVWTSMGDQVVVEPRALGPVMRRAQRLGWATPTDRYVLTERPEAHRRPVRVWRSMIWGPS